MKKVESLQNKILSGIALERWLTIARFKNRKIVLTHGSFDLLHEGHIRFLAEASDLGDFLVVALHTDASVKKQKGDSRPVLDQDARAMVLAALQFVSVVALCGEDELPDLVRMISPDVLAESSDGDGFSVAGLVKEQGGEVVTMDGKEGYSTADIRDRTTTG